MRRDLKLAVPLKKLCKWRRWESNPDPKVDAEGLYMLSRFSLRLAAVSRRSEYVNRQDLRTMLVRLYLAARHEPKRAASLFELCPNHAQRQLAAGH